MRRFYETIKPIFCQEGALFLGVILSMLLYKQISVWQETLCEKVLEKQVLYGSLQSDKTKKEERKKFIEKNMPLFHHLQEQGLLESFSSSRVENFLSKGSSLHDLSSLSWKWEEGEIPPFRLESFPQVHSLHLKAQALEEKKLYAFFLHLFHQAPTGVFVRSLTFLKEKDGFFAEASLVLYNGLNPIQSSQELLEIYPESLITPQIFSCQSSSSQEKESSLTNQDLTPHLRGILYQNPKRWTVWINGEKLTPEDSGKWKVLEVTSQTITLAESLALEKTWSLSINS